MNLLSRDHKITEKPHVEFPPYGKDANGETIRDLSGVVIQACLDHLEDYVRQTQGVHEADQALQRLARLLNDRLEDPAYHVTAEFLRNPWNSYSNEFAAFISQLCSEVSGDPEFQFNMARHKAIPPLIRTLGWPLSVTQIYRTASFFANIYSKKSFNVEPVQVTGHSATMRLTFTDHAYRQFGAYRRACAELWCNAVRGFFCAVPEKFHELPAAQVKVLSCIADGDESCQWEVAWPSEQRRTVLWRPVQAVARRAIREEIERRERIIGEQMRTLEARHEELHEAYVEQQQSAAELQRRVQQLTVLHETGMTFTATLNRDTLLQSVLEAIIRKLGYDRAMVAFYDPERRVMRDARVVGAAPEVEALARGLEVPAGDPDTPEGAIIHKGDALLITDLEREGRRLQPHFQMLAAKAGAKCFLSVPLKVGDHVIGSLTVDRTRDQALTQDDVDVMRTVATQLAVALDNANAYRQIEQLNVGLESKIRERTAELQGANERLREMDRVKSEFFANISHELRTPLTLSLGAFRALLRLSPTPESGEVIQAGLRNTSRLLYLINELLDLTKIESGQARLDKQCIDLAKLIRDTAANFEASLWRRIHVHGTSHVVPVEADARQLKKVLYNLLSNAFKFSDPDRGQVWLRVAEKGDWVEFSVEDNGIGIPSGQMERIFDRFTQVEGSATRRYEGSGIGLALVKEVVTLHGGQVTVESVPERGSTFTVTLPRGAARPGSIVTVAEEDLLPVPSASADRPGRAEPAAARMPPDDRRPLILIADDNADMRGYLKRALGGRYRILLAKDGTEAVELARTARPDLILTDVMMPKLSGYDVLDSIRSDEKLRSTPVVFLTARAGADARIESLEAGADDYVAKPFDEEEVRARADNLIRSRAQERALHDLQKQRLSRFLPPRIGEMVLSGEHEDFLSGHRAEITVAFIDLRGFTAFAESAEPEDVMAVLREYHRHMGELIQTYQGTLERFAGDALMVYFNDPVPVAHHALQAVRMAVAMRERMASLHAQWTKHGFDLGTGIGIATGYATLGLIGFQEREDYGAIGTVTNLAARLCAEAKHGQILVAGRAHSLIEDAAACEPVGELPLKGLRRPVPAYDVTMLR